MISKKQIIENITYYIDSNNKELSINIINESKYDKLINLINLNLQSENLLGRIDKFMECGKGEDYEEIRNLINNKEIFKLYLSRDELHWLGYYLLNNIEEQESKFYIKIEKKLFEISEEEILRLYLKADEDERKEILDDEEFNKNIIKLLIKMNDKL